jgi:hypothetical protein
VALVKPKALQAEDLSRSIHAAILKLASERAGLQIDEMPKNFLTRIEALVTSIGQKMAAGKVHINADDYKVMLPYLADAHFDFVAESSLARGDIILKFAGVELDDIAESRLGGQYAETVTGKVEAALETADLAAESTPSEATLLETTPSEATLLETTLLETTLLETTPLESTPLESTLSEATPSESTPLESTPLETTPLESTPSESTPLETTPLETTPLETTPLETTPLETTPLETTQAESAPKIRMMTTVRPLVTDNSEPDTTEGDQLLPSPDEKTS